MNGDDIITVCAECRTACCWAGELMCEEAKGTDAVDMTVAELRGLRLESEHYWEEQLEEW